MYVTVGVGSKGQPAGVLMYLVTCRHKSQTLVPFGLVIKFLCWSVAVSTHRVLKCHRLNSQDKVTRENLLLFSILVA